MRVPRVDPITIGHYTLMETGLIVRGRPSYENHLGVGDFIQRSHHASGFWLADWLRYGESRADWRDRLDQAVADTGLTEKTLKNVRAVGRMDPDVRRSDLEFALHETVAALPKADQAKWLEEAATHGLNRRELRLQIRASKRRKVIEGQAILSGVYRVVYADPPWSYGRAAGVTSAHDHYTGMTIDQLCQLPVAAHCYDNSVLFMWVTAPMLYYASDKERPDPFRLMRAWGFEPKTGIVWDKVLHNFGNYVSVRHEHLIIATRGSCTPDRPVPMPDSVQTERQDGEHSAKPPSFRKLIEALYDGPYLELFARDRAEGWDAFGNDATLWHQEVAS